MEEAFRFVRGWPRDLKRRKGCRRFFQCLRNSNFQWPDTGKTGRRQGGRDTVRNLEGENHEKKISGMLGRGRGGESLKTGERI
ncbi:hypothetical protein C1O54_04765 [Akkermansia muciniphila]|nr:hypothetical protein C1O54_04765 [Akkermansia muciniphila]